MYYDERYIDGKLMYRTSPDGEWRPCVGVRAMARRIEYLEAQAEACSARNSSDVDRIAALESALQSAFYEGFEAGDVDDNADDAWDKSSARKLLTQEE